MFIVDGAYAQQLRRELAVKLRRDVKQDEIAAVVHERLRNRGVTTRGVGRQTISRIENGNFREVDLEVINELAAYYAEHGIDASQILRYVRPKKGENEKNVAPRYATA
jgi:transcriptional regulator with XRE-family HTH domain